MESISLDQGCSTHCPKSHGIQPTVLSMGQKTWEGEAVAINTSTPSCCQIPKTCVAWSRLGHASLPLPPTHTPLHMTKWVRAPWAMLPPSVSLGKDQVMSHSHMNKLITLWPRYIRHCPSGPWGKKVGHHCLRSLPLFLSKAIQK